MKYQILKSSKLVLLTFLITITLPSCSSEDDSNTELFDSSFTALVDGEDFTADEVNGLVLESNEGNILTIEASKESGAFISITLPSSDVGTYNATSTPDTQITTVYSSNGQEALAGNSGTITITESTQISPTTLRVKATFSFIYSDPINLVFYEVTNGSFTIDFIVF